MDTVAPTPCGTEARAPPLLQMAGHGGHREQKNSKQETDQTVLTITKALTKTTKCTFRTKKWRGTPKNIFPVLRFAPNRCPSLSLRTGAPPPLLNSSRRHWLY